MLNDIFVDFNKNYFQKFVNKSTLKRKFLFSRNLTFINEMKFFVKHIKENKYIGKNLSIYNGIKTLQLALNLKGESNV